MNVLTGLRNRTGSVRYWLIPVIWLTLGVAPTRAACPETVTFSSITTSAVSYIYTPGIPVGSESGIRGSTVSRFFEGSFWALGAGDPLTGAGIDNGTFPLLDVAGDPDSGWSYIYPNYPAMILGTWSDAGVDGCIEDAPEPRCMVGLLTDVDPVEEQMVFAIVTGVLEEDHVNFILADEAPIVLAPWAKPTILSARAAGGGLLDVTVMVEGPENYRYGDRADCDEEILLGYRIHELERSTGGSPPEAPSAVQDWFPSASPSGSRGELREFGVPQTVRVGCSQVAPGGRWLYLSTTLEFESGYSTAYVGPVSTSIAVGCEYATGCGPGQVDGDEDHFCAAADCDDANDAVYPGAAQVCDGWNNDCGSSVWPDLDGTNESDVDGDGQSECGGDCDETRPTVFAGADQLCDGLNNDCNAPGWPALPASEADGDGDGFAVCAGDCDDGASEVYPGAPELCDDTNNDCLHPAWPAPHPSEADLDADGWSSCQGDCDDLDAQVHPAAQESCNGIDDDCNDAIDDDETGGDSDGDGIAQACDNCPQQVNPLQTDTDQDGVGNSCDNCTFVANPDQLDPDGDLHGDLCDNCPTEFNPSQDDLDEDRSGDACDNCPFDPNPGQADLDADLEGNACDTDDGLILISFSDAATLDWQTDAPFASWNLYRGDLAVVRSDGTFSQVPGSTPEASQECELSAPFWFDSFAPGVNGVVFYLVTGLDAGAESGLGFSGVVRGNDSPCP